MSLVVFGCDFSTLQQKPHDYICSGCKNMVSQKCTVFIGPPCILYFVPLFHKVTEKSIWNTVWRCSL